jgi:aminodeoxyfutalosine deaminase
MAEVERFYQELPKAELHLHLEGSLTPETLREIEPGLAAEEIARRLRPTGDFAGFLAAFTWAIRFLRGPAEYALAARRLLERLAAENVRYAEITLSAGVILHRGQDFEAIFRAVRAEAEASPVRVRWILDAVRQFGPQPALPVAELAAAHRSEGVVAFGLGGDEAAGPVEWFGEVFALARRHGLHLTIHAGETEGPHSVWGALAAGAERIGHGIRAAEDPALIARLRQQDVALEICLSSNLATGAAASPAAHPLRRLYEAGVPLVLNTDDPGLFGVTLAGEYERAARQFGFSREELRALAENGFRYAFDAAG